MRNPRRLHGGRAPVSGWTREMLDRFDGLYMPTDAPAAGWLSWQ